MNLKISEDDLFWSSLSDEGGECKYAKKDCDERLNKNVYYCKQNSHNNRKHNFIRRFRFCVSHHQE